MEAKLFMMPHTVPNRPTKGAVEPTEARKVICRSSCSISRPSVMSITRSMRSCRLVRMCSVAASPLAAQRRHSRMAATKIADIGSGGLGSRRSNRSSSEPPDQKASSNCLAWLRRRRSRSALSKMIAQVQNEASSSRIITILTMMSACRNRLTTDRSWPGGSTGMPPGSKPDSSGVVGVAGTVWSIG